jgi:hypothetical protein
MQLVSMGWLATFLTATGMVGQFLVSFWMRVLQLNAVVPD